MAGPRRKILTKLRSEGRSTKKELKAQMQSPHFWPAMLKLAGLIIIYYVPSIGLTFYQGWLIKELKFPITIVLTHFIMKFCLAWACRAGYTFHTGLERVTLGWSQMLGRVGVVAVVAALDIALSQWSFQYINVALYTMTKSSSIIFILFWGITLGLEKKHWSFVLIVLMIGAGLFMFTWQSTEFVLLGFSMVFAASFLSGIRWTVSQLIMQRAQYNLKNPFDMIYHVQPLMIIVCIPFAVGIEGVRVATSASMFRFSSLSSLLRTLSLVAGGGVIAFLMECAEFLLVSHTSSLTLSLAGIVKEIVTMVLAVVFQDSDMSPLNVAGLVVCMAGISLHVVTKADRKSVV